MSAALFACAPAAQAQSLSDILSGLGSAASGVVEGLFTKTNLTVNDVVGEWQGNGPAVCFKDDNFLKKAGGAAMSGVIEDKLAPYYAQFGLNDIKVTINSDATFKMSVKLITLSGTLASNGDGTFVFNFTALGSMSLGKMTAYVQKSGNNLSIMFDATKMKDLLSKVASFTKIKLATTVSSILDSYDGLCVGFKLTKTGTSATTTNSSSGSSNSLGGMLESILGGSGSTTEKKSTTETEKTTTTQSPLEKLKEKIGSRNQ